ncbi:MAG: DUF1285 domain-containing protein [Gammaproteobacteria bacterium]
MTSKHPADLMSQLQAYEHELGSLPPVHLWNPPLCTNVQMRIDRQGRWYYMDSPIGRDRMVRLFSKVLRFDEDGCYYLVTPIEKIRVLVEDSPFSVLQWHSQGQSEQRNIWFTANTGERFPLDSAHPLTVSSTDDQQPIPRVIVRSNLRGLISRNLYYQLINTALDEQPPDSTAEESVGLYSFSRFFSLQPQMLAEGHERASG